MSVLRGRVRRCATAAIGTAVLGAALAGCTSSSMRGGGAAVSSSGVLASQRAGYVQTMLSNSYTSGPETERGIMSVIAGFGGGYVTSTALSGAAGTPEEELTLNVVIGAGQVVDSMQGEGVKDPSDPRCYIYTVGFYSHVEAGETTCPATLTLAKAQVIAKRQLAAELIASRQYAGPLKQIPDSLAAAEKALGFTGKSPASTAPSGSSFAAGPGPEGKPAAGLALPQPGGACIYAVYRWIKSSPMPGVRLPVGDGPSLVAWAAPTDEPCRGSAALAAAGFITVDTYEGG